MMRSTIACLISFSISFFPLHTMQDYRQLFLQDLNHIKTVLEENHPGFVDDLNVHFKTWLKEGFVKTSMLADHVTNKEAYFFALRTFINGFKDAHLGLSINFEPKKYINDVAFYYDGNDYRVISDPTSSIPAGARLVSIDDMPTKEFLLAHVFKFFGNPDLAASLYKAAAHLSIWIENPLAQQPKLFQFEYEGNELSQKITWRIDKRESPASEQQASSCTLEKISPDIAWVRLPTFQPGENEAQKLKLLIESLKAHRNDTIVFDVRGNTGGNSAWGSFILGALCGQEYYTYCKTKCPSTIDWCVSQGNIEHLQNLILTLTSQFVEQSNIVTYFNKILYGMKSAFSAKRHYYHEIANNSQSITEPVQNHYTGNNIFVIIDEHVASACLDFIDYLKLCMKNVILIGHPTHADSLYMEVRTVDLPSEQAKLTFPIKVFRQRIRANNESYSPDVLWPGLMRNTQQLQNYLLTNIGSIEDSLMQ